MSDHDELRDALAPAGESMPAHSLTASEVRKLGTARLRRQQAGRIGVGALAVAAVVGLVAVDPMGLSHDHRGGAALNSPSQRAVSSSTRSATPRGVPSSATSARASGAATPFTQSETAVAPTAANPPVGTVCTAQNPAWAAAFTQGSAAAPVSAIRFFTASGYAEQVDVGGGNLTLSWYPNGDRTQGQLITTLDRTHNDGMTVVTGSHVLFNRGSELWLWDHQSLRAVGNTGSLGSFALYDGAIYYVGGSFPLQLHRRTLDGADSVVPNVQPSGHIDSHGFYVVSSPDGLTVWDLAGNRKASPPADLGRDVSLAGSHLGQPVYTSSLGVAIAADAQASAWRSPSAIGGTITSSAVVRDTLIYTVPGRVVAVPMDAASTPQFAFPIGDGLNELSAVSTTADDTALLFVGRQNVAPTDPAPTHATPVSSLPDLQGC